MDIKPKHERAALRRMLGIIPAKTTPAPKDGRTIVFEALFEDAPPDFLHDLTLQVQGAIDDDERMKHVGVVVYDRIIAYIHKCPKFWQIAASEAAAEAESKYEMENDR